MAFDSTQYKMKQLKALPVLLLLDVSSSMSGEKISALNEATASMIREFAKIPSNEVEIDLAVMTFASQVFLHTPFQSVKLLQEKGWTNLEAGGCTAFATALAEAKVLLEDRSLFPGKIYRPAVVVVSDGQPTDEFGSPSDQWLTPLQDFVSQGRSAKCQRFAIAIGAEANQQALETFTGNSDLVFQADDASQLKEHFAFITQTVSQRSASVNPNSMGGSAVAIPIEVELSPNLPPLSSDNMEKSPVLQEDDYQDFADFDDDEL